jgi:hypothetical protein
MRNYADEILFIETAKVEQHIQRSPSVTANRRITYSGNSTSAARPLLRARWVLVDESLQLIWSEDHEEPLRRVA